MSEPAPAAGTPPQNDLTPARTTQAGKKPARRRDHRIDALRGIALIMMFLDHMPQNILNQFTLRNFGFADAAEIFILLAGYSSWLAYGRSFPKNGTRKTLEKVGRRVVTLYLAQIVMSVFYILTIHVWEMKYKINPDFIEPELHYGFHDVLSILALRSLPSNLNILPIYMVLISLFPLIYLCITRAKYLLLTFSILVWGCTNLIPSVNFPNWLDPDGWYFDPFAWQLLFVLGICFSISAEKHSGNLIRSTPLRIACGLCIIISFLRIYTPLLDFIPVPAQDKSILSPLRLLYVLSLFYVVQTSTLSETFARSPVGQIFCAFGRNSLTVFVWSTIIDLVGRLFIFEFHAGAPVQILIDALGIAFMYALSRPRPATPAPK